MKLIVFFFLFKALATPVCSIEDGNNDLKEFLKAEKVAQSQLIATQQTIGRTKVPVTHVEKIEQDTDSLALAKTEADKKYRAGVLANSYRLSASENAQVGNSVKSISDHKKAAEFFDIKSQGQKVSVTKEGDVNIPQDVHSAIFSHMMAGEREAAIKYIQPKDYMALVERMNNFWVPQVSSKATIGQQYAAMIEKLQMRKLQLTLAEKSNSTSATPYINQIKNELPAIKREIEKLSRVL